MTGVKFQRAETNEDLGLTAAAARQILRVKEENAVPEGHGLRLSVKGGTGARLSYVLGFDEAPGENDSVIESNGIRIFVDQRSLFFLSGTTLDFSDGENGKGFVFNTPRGKSPSGCGNPSGGC